MCEHKNFNCFRLNFLVVAIICSSPVCSSPICRSSRFCPAVGPLHNGINSAGTALKLIALKPLSLELALELFALELFELEPLPLLTLWVNLYVHKPNHPVEIPMEAASWNPPFSPFGWQTRRRRFLAFLRQNHVDANLASPIVSKSLLVRIATEKSKSSVEQIAFD